MRSKRVRADFPENTRQCHSIMVLYETHFKNADKAREMVFTPDGRTFHEQGDKTGSREEDDDKD
jgi:hypothetical protein